MSGYRTLRRLTPGDDDDEDNGSSSSVNNTIISKNPIWSVTFLTNDSFVTSCADGTIRAYSTIEDDQQRRRRRRRRQQNIPPEDDNNNDDDDNNHEDEVLRALSSGASLSLHQTTTLGRKTLMGSRQLFILQPQPQSLSSSTHFIIVGSLSLDGLAQLILTSTTTTTSKSTSRLLYTHLFPSGTGTNMVLWTLPKTSRIVIIIGYRDGSVVFHPTPVRAETDNDEDVIMMPLEEYRWTMHPHTSSSSSIRQLALYANKTLAVVDNDGTTAVATLLFSPNSSTNNAACDWMTVHLTHICRHGTVGRGGGAVTSLAFAHDGGLLFSAGMDGMVRIWDIVKGTRNDDFDGNDDDDDDDGTVRNDPLVGYVVGGHEGWILNVFVCPLGKRFVTTGADGTVKVWDVATRQMIHAFEDGHEAAVWGVGISPDGTRMVSAGEDGILQFYSVDA